MKAVLVQVIDKKKHISYVNSKIQENLELFKTRQLSLVFYKVFRIEQVHPHYYIGSGQATQLQELLEDSECEIVVFSSKLSYLQEKMLQKLLKIPIIDRNRMILDIFIQHANSAESKMQVQLSELLYQESKLVRFWDHLERQKGGIGLRGGPGEKQIEIDRRLIKKKIQILETKLNKWKKQIENTIQKRLANNTLSISILGYTNAGKTTLFNKLSNEQDTGNALLFATLATTTRKLNLAFLKDVLCLDTIGFIEDLPPYLIDSFRGTLANIKDSHLLLVLSDIQDSEYKRKIKVVLDILRDLKCEDIPKIFVNNKIDLLNGNYPNYIEEFQPNINISAVQSINLEELKRKMETMLSSTGREKTWFTLPYHFSNYRSLFYEKKMVIEEETLKEANKKYQMQHYRLKLDIDKQEAKELLDLGILKVSQ